MSKKEILEGLKKSVIDGDPEATKKFAEEAVKAKVPAYEAVMDGMSAGMKVVGEKFENKEFYVSDLIMAGEAMKAGLEILEPAMKTEKAEFVGKVVIGVVEGDVHDIGKNLVVAMLRSAGLEVYDLGIDNTAEKFVEKAKEIDADIVAASAYTSTSMPHLRNVLTEIKKSDIKDKVTYIIGGAPTTEDWAVSIGADGWAGDAMEAVKVATELIKKRGS
ncbi:MAG: B12-binding domain-containing protein [Candidatus Lokiarchaeia archaeon]